MLSDKEPNKILKLGDPAFFSHLKEQQNYIVSLEKRIQALEAIINNNFQRTAASPFLLTYSGVYGSMIYSE